jgi:hypothetical protein
LYSFNGSVCSAESEGVFESPIYSMGTNNDALFIFLNNSEDFYIVSKTEIGGYLYSKNTLM